jgi:hypothetical protein
LSHLGITFAQEGLSVPSAVLPPTERGRYSDWNVNGKEIVRKDLPKETLYNQVEAPDWGSSYGTHTVALPYERYPRDFVTPSLTRFNMKCPNPAHGQDKYMIVFEVDRILVKGDPNFDADLLACLNLLQENVGCCGVQSSAATIDDYLRSLKVMWELLPPGTREEAIARLFNGRTPSLQEKVNTEDRYDFLLSLHPAQFIYGTSGLERYFGASLKDDLVIFENISYGNAIYIMFEDWRELSQRTRTELLSGRYGQNFERVLHKADWKKAVRAIVKERMR